MKGLTKPLDHFPRLSHFIRTPDDPSPFGDTVADVRADGETDGDNSTARRKNERGSTKPTGDK